MKEQHLEIGNTLIEAALTYYGIKKKDFMSQNRKCMLVDIRCCITKYLRDNHKATWNTIAKVLNRTDHTTIMSLYKRHYRLSQDAMIIDIDNLLNSCHEVVNS